MKIKGAVLYEQGLPRPYAKSQPLKIETLDLEGPRAGEVLVKVGAAGLCVLGSLPAGASTSTADI